MSNSSPVTRPLQLGEILDKPEDRVDVDRPAHSGKESGNVGEVRRKVAEMSYTEDNQETADSRGNATQATEDTEKLGDGWETIEKSEAVDTAEEQEGLKRKAIDRTGSSFFKEDGDVPKKLKDEPLVGL
jgi:hypothetical protein